MNREELIRENSKLGSMTITLSYLARIPYMEIDVARLLKNQGINRICIYGMGLSGQSFFQMMKVAGVSVSFVLDRNPQVKCEGTEIRMPEKVTDDVDAIVIASELYFDEMRQLIKGYVDVPVILLRDLLEQLLMVSYEVK